VIVAGQFVVRDRALVRVSLEAIRDRVKRLTATWT
jgi:hypothetical protein